jgi:hypothetical protein
MIGTCTFRGGTTTGADFLDPFLPFTTGAGALLTDSGLDADFTADLLASFTGLFCLLDDRIGFVGIFAAAFTAGFTTGLAAGFFATGVLIIGFLTTFTAAGFFAGLGALFFLDTALAVTLAGFDLATGLAGVFLATFLGAGTGFLVLAAGLAAVFLGAALALLGAGFFGVDFFAMSVARFDAEFSDENNVFKNFEIMR